MAAVPSIVRTTLGAILAYCLTGSCAVGQDAGDFSAETPDGRVHFFLSGQTARSAFVSYCESRADNPCDVFERYKIEVNFDEDVFGLTFIHEDPDNAPSADGVSIVCAYALSGRRECHTGRHRY